MKERKRRPRLAGFVRERGNSRSLIVRIGGKQYSRAVETRTKKEALALLPAFIAEVQSGAFMAKHEAARIQSEAPTFGAAIETFIRDYMRPASDLDGEASRSVYRHALTRVAREIGTDRKTSEITETMIHRALRTLHQGVGGKPGLSAATITTYRAVLSVFFRRMVKLGLIAASPVPPLGDLKLSQKVQAAEHGRHTALPREHVAALLEACAADPSLKVWATVMAATGARPGEALGLRWQDVDLDRGTLRIAHSVKLGTQHGQGRLGSTKTPGSIRTLPIGPALVAVLTTEKARQEGLLRVLHGMGDSVSSILPLVGSLDCVMPAGWDTSALRQTPVSLSGIRSRFKRAARRAGIPHAHAHQFRHSAITAMIAGTETKPGVSVVDAARLAGHSSPTITAKTYAHAVQSNLQRAAALADDLITPAKSATVEPLRNTADASSGR
jgi:integrase